MMEKARPWRLGVRTWSVPRSPKKCGMQVQVQLQAGACAGVCACVGCAFAPANAEANSPVTEPQPTVATVQRNRT